MENEKQQLLNFIDRVFPIQDPIKAKIIAEFQESFIKKNEFILKQGQTSSEFLFLEKGIFRSYLIDINGNEVTTGFSRENSLVFEVASFFKRVTTNENIHALSDCKAWTISYEKFQELFHSIPEFREFGRTNLVNGFIALKERTIALINQTAEQRYEHLLKTRPEIFQNVPLKYIASYLGITDSSLSRIRKDFSKK